MSGIRPWGDEAFIRSIWSEMGEQVKVARAKSVSSWKSSSCLVEFPSTSAAEKALKLDRHLIPNTDDLFKLSWASDNAFIDEMDYRALRDDRSFEYLIFVDNLGPEVNESMLVSLFQARFPSCKSAEVIAHPIRDYGFISFSNENDQQRAILEMQNVFCGDHPMRIYAASLEQRSEAIEKVAGGRSPFQTQIGPKHPRTVWGNMASPIIPTISNTRIKESTLSSQNLFAEKYLTNQLADLNNTIVLVETLASYVTEDELREAFWRFGKILNIQMQQGKGYALITFADRRGGEEAISNMQGYRIGNSRLHLKWLGSPASAYGAGLRHSGDLAFGDRMF
ncbi:hypothetical protein N431DRAFT_148671 [Stipitochalara longipes BDJ]|nr:hypothetical protein N431DRAFT_148671 [Stipitochalara longipes BDJ]